MKCTNSSAGQYDKKKKKEFLLTNIRILNNRFRFLYFSLRKNNDVFSLKHNILNHTERGSRNRIFANDSTMSKFENIYIYNNLTKDFISFFFFLSLGVAQFLHKPN